VNLRTSRSRASGRLCAAFLASSLLLAACGGTDDEAAEPAATSPEQPDGPDEPDEVEDLEAAPDEPAEPEVDPAEVEANELGQIPVIMYHRILPDGGGEYDNTPEEFRGELTRLHEAGFVPITAAELAEGSFDVPAGTTPVVLTFDDASIEQYDVGDDGEVVPDTAVGIMLDLAEELDGFEPTGSFYVLGSVFGQSPERGQEYLVELDELGFELGNHTAQHENLGQLDAAGVQRALVEGVQNITEALPDYDVRTLSYPFGVRPESPDLTASGEHDGVTYRHVGGLLVGSGPAPSPFDAEFDPLAIPRIRSQPNWSEGDEPDYASGFWLTWFEDNPERRYISDGNPDTVSFPEALADQLDPELEDRANPY
jgi:peptidoglycan/xylan/chitin deacetylase (PgdA/CDA1 family)